jgi:hypothetical protein
LTKRFDDLAENHQEMIKIKDEYKNSNYQLMQENAKLNEKLKNFNDEQIKSEKNLREEVQNLKAKCHQYEKSIEDLNTQISNKNMDFLNKNKESEDHLKNVLNDLNNSHLTNDRKPTIH